MKSNYKAFVTPQFAFLSDNQKRKVHLGTLEILRRTGVRVYCEEALELLRSAGCSISDGDLVRIPAHLVADAIRTAPPGITVYDRKGRPAMFLEDTNVYYGTGSDLPYVIDPYTGQRRKSTKQDIANAAKVCDALPNISFIMSMGLPSDVAVATSDVHSFEAMVTSSIKPIVYTAHDEQGLSDIIEIASAVAGGPELLRRRPFLILYSEPSTPLQQSQEATEKLLLVAKEGLPVVHAPGMVLGAAAPVTIGGAMVLANAELLSALLIAQLKRPGTPFIYGSAGEPLDMHTMVLNYAAPEHLMIVSAMAEMGRFYNLPTWGFSGCSDSKLFDEQASMEAALWTLMSALAGNNLVHDVGYIESGLTCSLEMIAASDELVGACRRIMGGIQIDDETLALDTIDEVGPGGHFLSAPHTLRHFKENWYPTLSDRHNYDEWAAMGGTTYGERARQKVIRILEDYHPEELTEDIRDAISAIVGRSEKRAQR